MAFQVRDLMASVLPSIAEDGAAVLADRNQGADCSCSGSGCGLTCCNCSFSCGCTCTCSGGCTIGSGHYTSINSDLSNDLAALQAQLEQQLGMLVS